MTLMDLIDSVVADGNVLATIFDRNGEVVKSYHSFANGGASVDFPTDYMEKEMTHMYASIDPMGSPVVCIELTE